MRIDIVTWHGPQSPHRGWGSVFCETGYLTLFPVQGGQLIPNMWAIASGIHCGQKLGRCTWTSWYLLRIGAAAELTTTRDDTSMSKAVAFTVASTWKTQWRAGVLRDRKARSSAQKASRYVYGSVVIFKFVRRSEKETVIHYTTYCIQCIIRNSRSGTNSLYTVQLWTLFSGDIVIWWSTSSEDWGGGISAIPLLLSTQILRKTGRHVSGTRSCIAALKIRSYIVADCLAPSDFDKGRNQERPFSATSYTKRNYIPSYQPHVENSTTIARQPVGRRTHKPYQV